MKIIIKPEDIKKTNPLLTIENFNLYKTRIVKNKKAYDRKNYKPDNL